MITSLIWLPASLIAGLFQAWRTAVQQRLRADLSVSGAGLVRYLYGAPIAVALAVGYATAHGLARPHFSSTFVTFAVLGGLAQIVGTNLLITAFGYRNFVVGTAFSKTEAVQAALFAWIALGEHLSGLVILGIGFGVAGVLVLSLGGSKLTARQIAQALRQPAALCGLGAGALFALTGVFVKRATMELVSQKSRLLPDVSKGPWPLSTGELAQQDSVAAALATLAIVMLLQTVMHGAYVAWREPATLRRVAVTWRTSSQVGVLAALGSACWFVGFATAPVALVRIVGQVEVVFTLAFARIYLRELTKRHEASGLLLVAAGVILALLGSIA